MQKKLNLILMKAVLAELELFGAKKTKQSNKWSWNLANNYKGVEMSV